MALKKYPFVLFLLMTAAFSSCEKEEDPGIPCTRTAIQNTGTGEVNIYFKVESISPELEFYVKLEIPKRGTIVQIAKASFQTNSDGMHYGLSLFCFTPGDYVRAGVYTCSGEKPASEKYKISLRPITGNYSFAEETLPIGEPLEYVVK